MKCGCTGAFLLFDGEWGKILLLANLFSHLSSLRMWKFLSGFGRTRWADTAAAFLGRPEFSRIQLLTRVCAFLRVKRETFSHSWKKTQSKPSGHRNPSFQFYWALFDTSDTSLTGCFGRCPLLLRSRSVEFSGEIGSPLFAQPSVRIRNVLRNSISE